MRVRLLQRKGVEVDAAGGLLLGSAGDLAPQELAAAQHGVVLKKVVTQQEPRIRGILGESSFL